MDKHSSRFWVQKKCTGSSLAWKETEPTIMIINENKARVQNLLGFCIDFHQRNEHETTLKYASLLGSSAWFAHAGFYAHPIMETMLSEIASTLAPNDSTFQWHLPHHLSDGRRWLHILSTAYTTGGHTRLAQRWMLNALERERHSFVLLNQEGIACPDWLVQAALSTGGAPITFPNDASMLEKAAWLRKMAYEWADVVVLHTHPDDPVPNVAFGIPGGPPVLFVNHAAQTFWYGSNIADTIIDFREPEAAMSYRRRYAKRVDLIPMPLNPLSIPFDKLEYKRRLGIDPHLTVLLTIASAYKYVPFAHYNFPKAVSEVLCHYGDCLLLVVGPNLDDPHWQEAIALCGGRIRMCGLQPNLESFYGSADLFLESFPFGSFTAALDAAMLGIPVILAPEPIDPILGLHHYLGMYPKPLTIEAYCEILSNYIRDLSIRSEYGIELMHSVRSRHDETAWKDRKKQLIENLPIEHTIGLADAPYANEEVELDRLWAQMQRFDGTHEILAYKFDKFNQKL
jgi:glycosyltransferase involved in cell wall biosynthesis